MATPFDDEEDDAHDQELFLNWCQHITTPSSLDFDLANIASIDALRQFISNPLPRSKRIPALSEWKREFRFHRCPNEMLLQVFDFLEEEKKNRIVSVKLLQAKDNATNEHDKENENTDHVNQNINSENHDNSVFSPADIAKTEEGPKEIIWALKRNLLNLFFGELAREIRRDQGNEDSYHCVLDCRVLNVLRTPFATQTKNDSHPVSPVCREYRNDHTPIFTRGDHQRLDSVLTLDDDPVFVGEEKLAGNDPRESLRKAHKDLHKIVWIYGDTPWILGYASAGYKVDLVAITPARATRQNHECHEVAIQVIAQYDLQKPWTTSETPTGSGEQGRLELLRSLLNLASILPSLQQRIRHEKLREARANPNLRRYNDLDPEFFQILQTLQARPVGNRDTANVNDTSPFPLGDVDVLANEERRQARVMLIGERYVPQTVSELEQFVHWVLATVGELHDAGIIHHNLQHWESYRQKDGKWFLANFKDASTLTKAKTRKKCDKLAKANAQFPELAQELRRGTTFIVDHMGLACLIESWFQERHMTIKWHARRLVQSLKKARRKTLSQETKSRLQVSWIAPPQ